MKTTAEMIRLIGAALVALTISTAAAAETVKVAIGQKGLWDSMITVHAIEEGFFAKQDLDVEITWTKGGSETLQAVITGSVDFALSNGILGVIGAYAKGAPIRIASAQSTGAADLFWYARANSAIQSLKDADGKTMGFSRPGSSTNLVALALASHTGANVELVPTGGIGGTRTQVMSEQVDIGWSVPPYNLDLVNKGEIRIIARGSDVPDLAEQTVRVNVVNADFLSAKRDAATRFMQVYADTIDWMYENQDAALARYAAANKIDAEVARNALDFYPRAALAVAPIAGLDKSIAQAVEYKRLSEPLSAAQKAELVQLLVR